MTDGGKFIGITGILSVGLCVFGAACFFAQEFAARAALPIEMQTFEMIQKHYDGEVVLFSITFGILFLFLALILAFIFGTCFAIYESKCGRLETKA
jgi:hypothetical protein